MPPLDQLEAGVRAGDRATLARAITLVESKLPAHQALAGELLARLAERMGSSHRVGITGVPGVGKSTFVEALGVGLCEQGHRVAVLAIDPSSTRTGGSILGDKTRMNRLATHERAFVRPSPTSGTLGGVARHTREALLLCEAAGYDIVIVETVGVGQSELLVSDLTDTFLVLLLPGAGDELQGIKRGLMERADLFAVNKADLSAEAAQRAASTVRSALRLLQPNEACWQPEVLTCSAQAGEGVTDVWQAVLRHRAALEAAERWQPRRAAQQRSWLWQLLDEGLRARFRADPAVVAALPALSAAVDAGTVAPSRAATMLLDAFTRAH